MKLSEEVDPRLEVVAKDPRLDVREPRLLPDEQDRVLADRLQGAGGEGEKKKTEEEDVKTQNHRWDQSDPPLRPAENS